MSWSWQSTEFTCWLLWYRIFWRIDRTKCHLHTLGIGVYHILLDRLIVACGCWMIPKKVVLEELHSCKYDESADSHHYHWMSLFRKDSNHFNVFLWMPAISHSCDIDFFKYYTEFPEYETFWFPLAVLMECMGDTPICCCHLNTWKLISQKGFWIPCEGAWWDHWHAFLSSLLSFSWMWLDMGRLPFVATSWGGSVLE